MSHLEQELAFQFRAYHMTPEREYRFHPRRQWKFDFCFPEARVGIECEGGIFSGGRHTRGKGFADDCEKYNAAAALGWIVLRYPAKAIKSGEAIIQIRTVLAAQAERRDAVEILGACHA